MMIYDFTCPLSSYCMSMSTYIFFVLLLFIGVNWLLEYIVLFNWLFLYAEFWPCAESTTSEGASLSLLLTLFCITPTVLVC